MAERQRITRESVGQHLPVLGMVLALLLLVGWFALAHLRGSGEVTTDDLPADLVSARPTMSAEDGRFIVEAKALGVDLEPSSLDTDIETGRTVCWALHQGLSIAEVAVRDDGSPLGSTGDDLRQRRVISAGIVAYCPDREDDRGQLGL